LRDRIDRLDRLLRSVNHSIMATVRETVEPHGIPRRGMEIIRHVHMVPGVTVSEIARRTGMAKSNVSNTVDSLLTIGMLEKRNDPADQRLVRIYHTPQADEHFQRVREAVLARLTEVLAVLGPAKVDSLIEALQDLETALAAGRAHETAGGPH